MRDPMQATAEGIPLKLTYGSDFPYRSMHGGAIVQGEGVNTKASMGKGGLSAVWGAAVMPYRQADLTDWPITSADLAPGYRAVLDFMPIAQAHDGLETDFPIFKATQAPPLSLQGAALWRKMCSHEQDLKSRGINIGRARLAVDFSGVAAPGSCALCGLCMYGCPYGLIYSSAQTVDAMLEDHNFQYLAGQVVTRIDETSQEVRIDTTTSGGISNTFICERMFLGAGVLPSTALMLQTLDAFGRSVFLKESHYFLLPMLRLCGVKGFTRGNLHTMAQLFIEIMDGSISPYSVHLQAYTYNDLFDQPIAQKLGALSKVFPWSTFLSRLFLLQGYLHSNHSDGIEARLEREAGTNVLHLSPLLRPEATVAIKKVTAKLAGLRGLIGMVPLSPLMRRGEPGRGFHTGGSFPMSAYPSGLESDTLGRPVGLKRIHLIDSSIFPTIPATTITLTIMANAYRIGTLALA